MKQNNEPRFLISRRLKYVFIISSCKLFKMDLSRSPLLEEHIAMYDNIVRESTCCRVGLVWFFCQKVYSLCLLHQDQ